MEAGFGLFRARIYDTNHISTVFKPGTYEISNLQKSARFNRSKDADKNESDSNPPNLFLSVLHADLGILNHYVIDHVFCGRHWWSSVYAF